MLIFVAWADPAQAGNSVGENAGQRTLVKPPPGFVASCARYAWLCSNAAPSAAGTATGDLLDLAAAINRRVNDSITQITDVENYGVAEFWTLPLNGRGDCEDLVLEKYRLLLDAGIESDRLSMAVVLDRDRNNHLVLILRTDAGDIVLDSLDSTILPWNQTGYTFLAMQARDDKSTWEVVVNRSRDFAMLAR